MGFYVDLEKIGLDDYREILKAADLLPSRMVLKEDIDERFEKLKQQKIENVEELRKTLSNKRKLQGVAEQSGIPLGFAIGRSKMAENLAVLPDGTAYLEVEDIYLVPEVRGRGIGSRLLKGLLDEAEQQGIHRALVYSSVKNIGQVIEYAMIHEKITELSSFSTRLNELVAEMKECSEEIEDQLEITKDIEGTLYIKEEKPEDA